MYLMDVKKGPIQADVPNPLSVYGKTKYLGDIAIEKSGAKYVNLRTSWVFSEHGHNFPKTILKLALKKETIDVVDDQFGSPTSAEFLAKAVTRVCRDFSRADNFDNLCGVYNLCSNGTVSWYDFAKMTIKIANEIGIETRCLPDQIQPISSVQYRQDAKRPPRVAMSTTHFQNSFQMEVPVWHRDLGTVLNALQNSGQFDDS